MLNIPAKTVSEVADAIEITEKPGVRVDWIDKVFGEIEKKKKKKHFELAQQLPRLRDSIVGFKEANGKPGV